MEEEREALMLISAGPSRAQRSSLEKLLPQNDLMEDERMSVHSGSNGQDDQERLLSQHHESNELEEFQVEDGESPSGSRMETAACRYAFILLVLGILLFVFKITMSSVLKSGRFTKVRLDVLECYNGSETFDPTVILVSLDGFRPDYLERNRTPHLLNLARHGVRAEYMHPSFPTLTFPNHWTLVTGLYPESHGIVANRFYDPALKKEFVHYDASAKNNSRWWLGEPIWRTVQRQGKRAGVNMWPGSSVTSLRADYTVVYNQSSLARERMDTALKWLDMPREERPHFIAIYIDHVDRQGHATGPTGFEIDRVIEDMDDAIGYLIQGLEARHLDECIQTIIVSDHGMAATHASRVIYYDDILSPKTLSWFREREAWPLLGLRPKPDAPRYAIQKAYEELYNHTLLNPDAHFQVYLREDMPLRYHYNTSERIAPVIAVPDSGYVMVSHEEWQPNAQNKGVFDPQGVHGYDNLAPDMRAIFIARGQMIDLLYRRNTVLAPFYNTEVYSFLCKALDIDPAPHNGTLEGQLLSLD